MPHHDDSDLWQTESEEAPRKNSVLEQGQAKRALLEQRRLDLNAITNLLTRAANDLRASERRAIDAEARAKEAEARVKEAEGLLAEAEEREKKINAQAARAFETMKERVELSDANAAEAQARVRAMEDRSADALLQLDKRTMEIEKAAEERSFELQTRLEAAEMRISAARRAMGDDLAISPSISSRAGATSHTAGAAASALNASDLIDARLRH